METVTTGQHVTLDPTQCPEWAKGETFTVEFVRPTKRDVVVVSTDDAYEGKAHMRRLDRVPFGALIDLVTKENIAKVVKAMKAEINECIADGQIPADVKDFSTLHDYIDANMLADDEYPQPMHISVWAEIFNPASDEVDAWLAAGRPE